MRKIQRNFLYQWFLLQNEIPNSNQRSKKDKERTVNEKLFIVSNC